MTRESIIDKTVNAMSQLPVEKAVEISDFADFIVKKYEESLLSNGLTKIIAEGKSYQFLEEEEDVYSLNDLKVLYNDKG
ncbi:MAG: hypothetical protein K9H61_14435 [Bacteroidia bacterium]|nr:hypothetical protein [Bacteroidia bacterium]MCF8428242.1 hypothetical protein [Bacteroidia bacterium]MCF8448185.1 hypothetical protein [Bacteroidia bacterium]